MGTIDPLDRATNATAEADEDGAQALWLAFEGAAVAIMTSDLTGRVLRANPAAAELTGYPLDELVGMSGFDLISDRLADAARVRLANRIRSSGSEPHYESELVRKDRQRVPVEISATTIRRGDDRVGTLAILRDITERKRTESELRQSEGRFRGLLESAPDAVVIVGERGLIEIVNRRAEELFGYPRAELVGQPVETLVPEHFRAAHPSHRGRFFGAPNARPMGAHLELYGRRKDGTEFPVEISLSPLDTTEGTLVTAAIRDVSARKEAERRAEELEHRLLDTQKLEAIGQLAAGIAHDFNNSLTAIRGFNDLLLARLPEDDPLCRYAEEIRRATENAAMLPRHLLAFARQQPLQPVRVELNSAVRATCELLQPVLGENIELVVVPGPVVHVRVDPGQLDQTLLNLALNSRDAMPGGGRLTISVRAARVDDALALRHEGATPGDYAVISVSDTGVGIDPDTKSRIFEPFFTTKQPGDGTGLGLSSVYGIARQSGGFLTVESTPGHGATFELFLPYPGTEAEGIGRPSGRGTVLVVEDEDSVRRLAREVIELDGFEVLEASDGADALLTLDRHARPIDAVLTDLRMPGIDGFELARRLRVRQPDLPVVLMSAYSERSPGGDDMLFVPKPFSASQLSDAVTRAVVPKAPGARPDASPRRAAAISIVIADDHPAVLDAVGQSLSSHGFDLLATATDGEAALRAIDEHRPELALLDIRMSGLTGIQVARQAAAVAPDTAVVLFTGYGEDDLLRQSVDAGVRGFLLKGRPLEEILVALEAVAAGEIFIDPDLTSRLVAADSVSTIASLTPRERQVLALLAEGMTNDGAAGALSISSETVQTHVRKAMAKLNADTRTAAVATALRHALIA